MNAVHKTLYIPLYGKAQVSRKGIILHDPKAEEIWERVQSPLKGKATSKWLTYFMSMRGRVFDDWTRNRLKECPSALVLHIGCGLDSRIQRAGESSACWYDVDFPEVIAERQCYFSETEHYHMLGTDASRTEWIADLPESENAIVILEGISMYLKNHQVQALFSALGEKYPKVHILMDVYTSFGAKVSKYKNPVNEVGVTRLYGIDDPEAATGSAIRFAAEHTMTPGDLVNELKGFERTFFSAMFTGRAAKKIYRLFEYQTI